MTEETKLLIKYLEEDLEEVSSWFELFLSIFGSEENLDKIKRSCPLVFAHLRNSLIDATLAGVCRFADPEFTTIRKNKKYNISLQNFAASISAEHPELNEALSEIMVKFDRDIDPLKKVRNEYVGHSDLEARKTISPPTIYNGHIDSALKLVEKFINTIYLGVYGYEASIINPLYPLGDGPERFMDLLQTTK